MPQLKLPRLPAPAPHPALPPELRWDAPRAAGSALALLSRREFLKAFAVLLAALAAPLTGARRALAAARGRFFTRGELATLTALCDRIIPQDVDPGGNDLGAPAYIERLLTAFDRPVPRIYAGGPFSNRNPFPDNARGIPSRRRPRNAFARFIPLSRLQTIRWRAELFGSDAPGAAGADVNDATLGKLVGLRQLYRDSLKKVDEVATAMAGGPFAGLPSMEQDRVLGLLDGGVFAPDPRRSGQTFMDVLISHTIEGCLAAPEYGGNRQLAGWKMVGLEGDTQPLGFSIFSRDAGTYVERADHPMSTPNPDELVGGVLMPRALSADGAAIQSTIATLAKIPGEAC